jgi:hypothetical protein
MTVTFLLGVGIATLSWAAVNEETQKKCKSEFWRFVVYNFAPNHFAKKCGCPHNIDFRFSCNSQYIPLL